MANDTMETNKCIQFAPGYSFASIKGSVLLLPSISVANVPQLTTDVLLHTLPFVKVGTLNDQFVHSFISPVDYVANKARPKGISLAVELYFCEDRNLALVQLRAPIIAGFHAEHVDQILMPIIEQAQFENVVLFHLMDAGLVEHIHPGALQVFTNEDRLSKSLSTLKISDSGFQLLSESPELDSPYIRYLLGKLDCVTKYSVMVAYAYEGDNFYDSINMASRVSELLDLKISQWNSPVSWFGVYGDKPVSNAMEDGLYV